MWNIDDNYWYKLYSTEKKLFIWENKLYYTKHFMINLTENAEEYWEKESLQNSDDF